MSPSKKPNTTLSNSSASKAPAQKLKASNKGQKIALGMSGGVDSSLTAHLLVEQGYDVTGIFLECWRAPGCRTDQDRKDALKVALSLKIPFKVLDFKQRYKEKVVDTFFADYKAGFTPNPDIWCNQEIKFGLFYDWAMDEGFDAIATGHYAQIEKLADGEQHLVVPADQHKDQTYFLYLIRKEQLEHIIFPLSELSKQEVRSEAEKRDLHNADKKDSVGICFIGDIDVRAFLREELGENPGEVVDTQGNVIGRHQGLWFYTIGQRHGFEIDASSVIKNNDGSETIKHNIPPFYVVSKKPEKNQLVVGFGADAFSQDFRVENLHWITEPDFKKPILVRIRHTGKLMSCTLSNDNQVTLDQPTKGIAEGQSAVFYQKIDQQMVCLGGGTILVS